MTFWLVMGGHGFKAEARYDVDVSPCPTVAATGLGSYRYWFEDDMNSLAHSCIDKPPYSVPSMAEIAAIPWNGCTVVSTFSGCGGSCLGYRLAGYRVLWANEFVPVAQASYRANAAPGSLLDGRDIKQVQPEDILQATGLEVGELDLLDGSPPCQAFSTAGKRHKGWGQDKTYEHGAKQKNETLFDEYIRLLRGLQPKVFVAENVSGLVKGVAKGFFLEILRDLKASGYCVEARLLDAQWLGVPQMRQRIIFVGVRTDLERAPAFPTPLPYRYSVREALPWIEDAGASPHGFTDGTELSPDKTAPSVPASGGTSYTGHWVSSAPPAVIHDTGNFVLNVPITERPCPAITVGVGSMNSSHYLVAGQGEGATVTARRPDGFPRRKLTIAELKRLCSFPDDFVLVGSYAQQWERLGNAVPPVMAQHIAAVIRDHILQP